jgi:hypothetical protein
MCGDGPGTATLVTFYGPGLLCSADGSAFCASQVFDKDCAYLNGSLLVTFETTLNDIPGGQLDRYMQALGFLGLEYITDDLVIDALPLINSCP